MKRFLSKYSVPLIVLLSLALALYLRIAVPYHLVFTDTGVRFNNVDAYSYMRLVDNTLANFPQRTPFDPYTYFPEGAPVYYPPLFSLFLSGSVWLFSMGSPTAHAIDTIGAFFPAILGALMVIPVFFIGKSLFNKWAGALGALLVAVLPGEILGRTMLGFTDHHVVEILFTTTAMMFFILALKSARQVQWNLNRSFGFSKHNLKPRFLSLLSGLFLGLYLQMWAGALLFILILSFYIIIQAFLDYWKQKSIDYLVVTSVTAMLTTSLITLPFLPRYYSRPLYLVSLPVACVLPVLLFFASRLALKIKFRPLMFAGSVIIAGMLVVAVAYLINPEMVKTLLANFNVLNPSELDMTIGEVTPLFFPDGNFSFSLAWANFTTGFYCALVALGILIYQVFKKGEPEKNLLVVWSLGAFALVMGQRRFAYYFAVNVAVLTGFLAWSVFKLAGVKEFIIESGTKLKNKGQKMLSYGDARARAWKVLAVFGVIGLVFIPNISPAVKTVAQVPYAPDDAWVESLTWLRDNSPSPISNPDLYYTMVEKTNPGLNFDYPSTAYGVMAWWDYGHWITRIAHRLPNHAPGGGRSSKVARCFLSIDEPSAAEITDSLDSLYLMIDFPTATTKLKAVCEWAGLDRAQFFETYYQENNGVLQSLTLFYPDYYKTLLVRLYSFDAKEYIPQTTTVISYETQRDSSGVELKKLTGSWQFKSYDEAEKYVDGHPGLNYRIVSNDPFVSPVPLSALKYYRLVFKSAENSGLNHPTQPTPVKTFIYLGTGNKSVLAGKVQ